MKGMYNYIFSIFAGCSIALGTGILTVPQFVLEYEKDVIKLAYEIEQSEGIVFDDIRDIREEDCAKLATKTEDCKYVKHAFEQSRGYLNLNIRWFYFILYPFLITLGLGFGFFLKYFFENIIPKRVS
ncbi:MAG: hypothetical protein JAY82_18260 [Candidatus Thiodiazotropha taylori]|nr:hypothetical protein [Candidatus Thiodiazotropha taylori]